MSSAEENKALIRRFIEAQNKGHLETLDELLAPDFIDHSLLPGQAPGREGFIQEIAEEQAALSDISTTIEYQATDGDQMVITRLTMRTIHDRGVFKGVAPTGKEWITPIILIHRVSGGKIVEEWSANSAVPYLEQIQEQAREHERIEQELRLARSIQQASLPKEVPQLQGWEISPFYQPAREVGGDFYDFFELKDGRLGLVVGDATGKGVPAALVMSSARSMLRAVAQASDYSPGEVLRRINDSLVTDIPANMFVTCFYAILDPESGHLSYANAGHTLPCCKRHNEDQADELRVRGTPLGLMPGMPYEEKETSLLPGDGVLLCTDGLVEAHNPQGEMFGSPRLRDVLSERSEGGKELSAALMEELERFTGEGREQEDDITLLTLRRSVP